MPHTFYNFELSFRHSLSSILAALNRHQRIISPVYHQCGHCDRRERGFPIFLCPDRYELTSCPWKVKCSVICLSCQLSVQFLVERKARPRDCAEDLDGMLNVRFSLLWWRCKQDSQCFLCQWRKLGIARGTVNGDKA